MSQILNNAILFVALIPDNVRSGLIILCYISAYFLAVAMSFYGGSHDE